MINLDRSIRRQNPLFCGSVSSFIGIIIILGHVWLYTIGGLDWWTELVDWTTGLTDFHFKHTGMIHNVAKSTTGQRWVETSITLLDLDLIARADPCRPLECDDLYHFTCMYSSTELTKMPEIT